MTKFRRALKQTIEYHGELLDAAVRRRMMKWREWFIKHAEFLLGLWLISVMVLIICLLALSVSHAQLTEPSLEDARKIMEAEKA